MYHLWTPFSYDLFFSLYPDNLFFLVEKFIVFTFNVIIYTFEINSLLFALYLSQLFYIPFLIFLLFWFIECILLFNFSFLLAYSLYILLQYFLG